MLKSLHCSLSNKTIIDYYCKVKALNRTDDLLMLGGNFVKEINGENDLMVSLLPQRLKPE
jgi:hypothetical protein